jgi:hypothetical protein
MATITEIRQTGTTILLPTKGIFEPLVGPENLRNHLGRFEDNYDLSNNSHLFRFLVALCGEAGAGSIKRSLMLPRLREQLEATHFTDLDRLYGNPLALPRLKEEIYSIDPRNEVMTQEQWQDVRIKDATYRARCLTWMRAIIEGPTPRGIALAGEAALGVECDVVERYIYLENLGSDRPVPTQDVGQTASPNEFVVVPRTPELQEVEKRRVMRLIDRLRPINSISSTYNSDTPRLTRTVAELDASTETFVVDRFVTGRPDIEWPPVDASQGYWIERGVENEVPYFAFMQREESATFISVVDVEVSSEQVGPFNMKQRAIFTHLRDDDPYRIYSGKYSFANSFALLSLSTPWSRGYGVDSTITLVNSVYPLGYFSDNLNIQTNPDDPNRFWASLEQTPDDPENLTLDFGSIRPVNFIDFEITTKPVDFTLYWSTDKVTWNAVENHTEFVNESGVAFIPGKINPWHYVEQHFDLVQARYIRIIFDRRRDPYPLITDELFPWSIEVRNLRAVHAIYNVDVFVPDQGIDILGNSYRTDLTTYDAELVIDEDPTTFWQSQPNPIPDAVEALYFDMRIGVQQGTMQFLDTNDILGEYDKRGQADMEEFLVDGVIVDEIYIDPVTFGADFHIYYSSDETPDWDEKLWTPVPRHYKLHKGFHALPSPTFAKFFKLEFTNLAPAPYESLEYPVLPDLTYKKFPTWVQDYFNDLFLQLPSTSVFDNPVDRVVVEPLDFYRKQSDQFSTDYNSIRQLTPQAAIDELSDFIVGLESSTQRNQNIQALTESQISFNSPYMFQRDLIQLLDDTHALSRYVIQTEADIAVEQIPAVMPAPTIQSVTDLTTERARKEAPKMFFPHTCRHGYQVLRATRPSKLAYFVAIREVAFYRRDYSIDFDETVYIESLDDDVHTERNDFDAGEWRYEVAP